MATAERLDTVLGALAGESQDQIAGFPKPLLERMLSIQHELGHKNGAEETQKEFLCRLLASGMSADELALVLCVKADMIRETQRRNAELIAKYAKQLKGRRKRQAEKNAGVGNG